MFKGKEDRVKGIEMAMPEGMECLSFEMSNFDHTIDPGMEKALHEKPLKAYAGHSAWNFKGYVWFDGKMFHEQIWVHHVPQEIISANTLDGLMEAANEKYGYE